LRSKASSYIANVKRVGDGDFISYYAHANEPGKMRVLKAKVDGIRVVRGFIVLK
jgi:hypothetical protein